MGLRIYIGSGAAEYFCDGLHQRFGGRHPDQIPAHERAELDAGGHHHMLFVWVPGCVHIDDHEPPVLTGCNHGCSDYHHVKGDDPRTAATYELDAATAEGAN